MAAVTLTCNRAQGPVTVRLAGGTPDLLLVLRVDIWMATASEEGLSEQLWGAKSHWKSHLETTQLTWE